MNNAKAQKDQRSGPGIYRPVFLLALAVLVVLALVTTVMVSQFDAMSRQLQKQAALQAYTNRFGEYAAVVQPRIGSDEAVRRLAIRFDANWAEHDLAHYFNDRNGINRLFVLGADDRLIFAARDGVRAPGTLYRPLAGAVADILPRLRTAEAARVQLSPGRDYYALIDRPIQAGNIAIDHGQAYIVTATLVQPDFGRAMPPGRRAPVVITALPFDERILSRLGARHLVANMRVDRNFNETPTRVVLPLRDVRGRAVAALSWTPRRPGSELFARLEWPLAAMFLILAMLGWSLVRQTTGYAKGLILSEARARHLAFHDTLTQLPNRALMFERLNQMRALARRSPLEIAVHCLDLDRFKEVNDTLGHPVGDALIRAVARRLAGLLRDTDTVARLGGDEFVILQPHTTATGASHLAERIIAAFRRPFDVDGAMVEIGCSIGITLIADPETLASEVLRQADLALYGSKEGGRNRATFFEPEMDAALRLRRQMEMDLREALAGDLLHMVYQPQVDADRNVVGVEALVRWDHPENGLIPPNVFVVLAEDCGLIGPLGEFTVRRVFEETGHWRGVPVAINVSALQLRAPGFMAMITRLVAEHAILPANYEFEITETVLLGDDAATRDNIAVLKQEGFAIALDDFGTGYSSLSSLQRFAIDKIKIDRAFVRNLDGDDVEAMTLVDAIIKLARALKLEVIAEGVETELQRQRLIACGCTRFQGFLFARPMNVEAVVGLVDTAGVAAPTSAPTKVAQNKRPLSRRRRVMPVPAGDDDAPTAEGAR
jgi:diguanylate cyclase (GGDEF)-like protein